jgi:hypothetical protein
MEDQFDEDLRDHIRKVFEEYEDPAATEGWALLREKFPEKNRRPAIMWVWWGAAAALLLFISLGLWRYEYGYKPGFAAIKHPKSSKDSNLMAVSPGAPYSKSPKDSNLIAASRTLKQQPGAVKAPVFHPKTGYETPIVKAGHGNNSAYAATGLKHDEAITGNAGNSTPVSAKKDQSALARVAAVPNSNVPPNNPLVNKATQANSLQIAAVKNAAVLPAVLPLKKADTANKPSKPKLTLFADNTPVKEKDRDAAPIIRIGVYAATYYSYATGSTNQGNLGGGVTAELRLTKNLKLVSGVGIAHNSLIFNNSIPTSVAQNSVLPGNSYAAAPAAFANVASSYSKNTVTVASAPDFKNYDASIYGIDVPINLKYEFNPKLYILAGFSSGTYIDESYTYKFNYSALYSPSLQQTHDETSQQNFNSFYFGKIVNFAFGFGYPLGRNNLIIEPFLKYPLDGLGSQNIRFGSGGINLKFNFPPGF